MAFGVSGVDGCGVSGVGVWSFRAWRLEFRELAIQEFQGLMVLEFQGLAFGVSRLESFKRPRIGVSNWNFEVLASSCFDRCFGVSVFRCFGVLVFWCFEHESDQPVVVLPPCHGVAGGPQLPKNYKST